MLPFPEIIKLLTGNFGNEIIEESKPEGLQPSITVPAEKIAEVCLFLRDHELTYFDYLSSLSGIDYGPSENKVGVAYHLSSIPNNGLQLTLYVKVSRTTSDGELPKVPTVSHIWKTAEWHEREAYDLIGIHFAGHPDLRRILCPDDWEGHPLRKDYKPQSNYHEVKVEY